MSGLPIHVLDARGNLVRSILSPAISQTGGTPRRILRAGSRGTIWAAERANYRIEQVELLSGKIVRVILVHPPDNWQAGAFRTRAQLDSVLREGRDYDVTALMEKQPPHMPVQPLFELAGFHESSDGFLWVAARVATPGWRTVKLHYKGSSPALREDVLQELYRTVVDVIDIRSGRLTARGDIAGLGQLLPDGTFARTSYDSDGVVTIEHFVLRIDTQSL
jgi:hypothetical protein